MNKNIFIKQILVIEENPSSLNLLQWVLEELGFQVHASQDFEDAAQFLKVHSPSLIISDFRDRKVTTGVDFYRHHVVKKKIPFALVSGTFYSTSLLLPPEATFTADSQNPHLGKMTLLDPSKNDIESIQCFEKPFEVSAILQHFHLSPAA